MIPITTGAAIKGMAKKGFITIGTPKINGSLMLKIPGTNVNLPIFLQNSDFPKKAIKKANDNVAPAPPIQINHWKNCSVIKCGTAVPAAAALILAFKFSYQKGYKIGVAMIIPWIPKIQTIVINKIGTITERTLSPAK